MKAVSVLVLVVLAACGSQQLKVDPVKIEPIHITVDVNLRDAGEGKLSSGPTANADSR